MTTNAPQPTNDDLERKLDEIKTALGIQTTTATTSSTLQDIKRQLEWSRHFHAAVTVMAIGISVALAGLQFFIVGGEWVLWEKVYYGFAAVIIVFAICWASWKKPKRRT